MGKSHFFDPAEDKLIWARHAQEKTQPKASDLLVLMKSSYHPGGNNTGNDKSEDDCSPSSGAVGHP